MQIKALLKIKGKFMISGNKNSLYNSIKIIKRVFRKETEILKSSEN